MKILFLAAGFAFTASLSNAQAQTAESPRRSTVEILRSIDSGAFKVNRIVGAATAEGMGVAAAVASEAMRTVESFLPTIMRIGQQTERLISDAEETIKHASESPEFRRAGAQLDEAVKRLEAAAGEIEKVGETDRR